jgi:quinolinate synthase
MAKTNEENLLSVLETWDEKSAVHVPAGIAADARLALERMLTV